MKIDRTTMDLDLCVDEFEYTKSEVSSVLKMIDEGNKSVGGLTHIASAHCLLGTTFVIKRICQILGRMVFDCSYKEISCCFSIITLYLPY